MKQETKQLGQRLLKREMHENSFAIVSGKVESFTTFECVMQNRHEAARFTGGVRT
jgi:hypothetical protein